MTSGLRYFSTEGIEGSGKSGVGSASKRSEVLLRRRLDDQLRHMRPRRELGDGDDDVGNVFGKKHFGAALGGDGLRTMFEDRRIDFARKDGGDANVVSDFFVGDTRAQGGDGEFRGV